MAGRCYLDYGAFTPVQVAATAALNDPEGCIREMRATHRRRRDVLVDSFGKAGWAIPSPTASMFAWAPVPEKFRQASRPIRKFFESADRTLHNVVPMAKVG